VSCYSKMLRTPSVVSVVSAQGCAPPGNGHWDKVGTKLSGFLVPMVLLVGASTTPPLYLHIIDGFQWIGDNPIRTTVVSN
jgi:hypothetical protein